MRNLNCLITGASSGIGASIAQELSKTVKHIYILSRNASKLEEIHDKIISNGGECTIDPIDCNDTMTDCNDTIDCSFAQANALTQYL